MLDPLTGYHALVTGASSGVGRAIAMALASAGAIVWVTARRTVELGRLADEAPRGRIRPLPGDLADRRHIEAIVEQVSQGGRLDVIVHAAATYFQAPATQLEPQALAETMAVNVVAAQRLTRPLLPLLEARHGHVIFINSSVTQVSGSGPPAYAASKHALRRYADALRGEVNARGIKVCSFFLGRTATPLQERLHAAEGRPYHPERLIQPDDVGRLAVAVVALPDSVELTDISLRPLAAPTGARDRQMGPR